MPRKKKTQQHIGHDPLAWLAEGDTSEQMVAKPEPEAAASNEKNSAAETPAAEAAPESTVDGDESAAATSSSEESSAAETPAVEAAPESTADVDESAAATSSEESSAGETPAVEAVPESTVDADESMAATSEDMTDIIEEAADTEAAEVVADPPVAANAAAISTLDPEPIADDMPTPTEDSAQASTVPLNASTATSAPESNAPSSSISMGWQTVTLPATLTLAELPALHQELHALLGQRIRLSGGEVTRIDTASVQLLVALMQDEDTTVGWVDASETLCQSAQILGLNRALNLAEFEAVE